MADFKTPNLCGASPELNNALSKLDDLKNEIASKLDSTASEAAAAFETGLANVKAGLDGLAIDLPEIPAVNFQSELTGLINDIDKTTIQGLAAFNTKLAQLELDFGDTLKEKGLTLDSLITDATSKLSGGGNICDLVPNIELPADGVVKEKPVEAKQAATPPEAEEFSSITKNASAEEVRQSLKTKQQDIDTGEIFSKPDETGFVKKADIVKDVEPVVTKSGGTISATTPAKSNVVTTETITTTTGGGYTQTFSAPVTKRKVQSDKGFTTRKVRKREHFILKGSVNEAYWRDGGLSFKGTYNQKKHKVIDDISRVNLKYPFDDIVGIRVHVETTAIDPTAKKARDYYGRRRSNGFKKLDYNVYRKSKKSQKQNELSYEFPYTEDQKLVEILDDKSDQPLSEGTRVTVSYQHLEKVDPNFSG